MKFSIQSLPFRSVAFVALSSLIAFTVFSGCKAEINVVVNEESEGEIELIAAVSDTILSLAQIGGEDPLGELLGAPSEELETPGLEGASIEPYSEAGYTGIRIRADFNPYDPIFGDLSENRSILGNLTETVGIGNFNFARTEADDGWIVELDQTTDASITEGLDDFVGEIPGDLPLAVGELDLPFILSLELPGEYVEHNADREVDGVLIWDANLLEGVNISATSRDPGSQLELVPIIITSIFAAIFLGIVIYVVTSRERRRKRAEEDAALEPTEVDAVTSSDNSSTE